MYVLFLAYANDTEHPLDELKDEDDQVYRSLIPGALQNHYLIHRESFASLNKIREFLILYRDHIFLFSFSGHADRDKLILDEDAQIGGMAKLLGRCPNLKMVFLNGCSTQGQVKSLLDAGVPCVIATSSPVGDKMAKTFGISFFQALSTGDSFSDSFEAATGAIMLLDKNKKVYRGEYSKVDHADAQTASWGLFTHATSDLSFTLPAAKPILEVPDFDPNSILIKRLIEALTGQSDELDFLIQKEKSGKLVSESKKRMAILNSLPAPIAEHLRKLMVPIQDENDGYDKLGKERLGQLVRTYEVTTELTAFTLMAQLWEAKILHTDLRIPEDQAIVIRDFLMRSVDQRQTYDYIGLVRAVRSILDDEFNKTLVNYFVPELEIIKELPYQNEEFMSATFFLQTLRQRMAAGGMSEQEEMTLCIRGEECLGEIFSRLGFLAKYQLAAVNNIDIQKYRHTAKPSFKHNIVRLIDLLGGLEQSEITLERFTDNRSVLLLREDEGLSELNLTPFILDKNAFEKDTDVSNIYFYSHYDRVSGVYYYYYVNNPNEEFLTVSTTEYAVIKAQMDAFRSMFEV